MNVSRIMILRLHFSDKQWVDWAILTVDGNRIDGDFNTAIDQLHHIDFSDDSMTIIVMVPGEDILFHHLAIPAKHRRYIKQTLPFMMEEVIADPIERMHFVSGRELDGTIPVMAVRNECMHSWLALLQAHGIKPNYMLSDTYAAALCTKEMHLIFDIGFAMLGINGSVVKTDTANLTTLLGLHLKEHEVQSNPPAPVKLIVTKTAATDISVSAEVASAMKLLEGVGMNVTVESIDNTFDYLCSPLVILPKVNRRNALVNLLQGPYESRGDPRQQGSWLSFIATVLICVMMKLTFDLATGFYLKHQTVELEKQITTLYHSLFPQDKKIVNIRVQMQAHLDAARQNEPEADFLTLIGLVGSQLNSMGLLSDVQVQQFRYGSPQNTLLLDINVKRIQQLDRLTQGLKNRGLEVVILSAYNEQKWIRGRLRITQAVSKHV